MYTLTKEGVAYLKKDLPEQRLIASLEAGPKTIEELSSIDNLSIAMSWAKKNGWIKSEKNKIFLTEAGRKALKEKYYLQAALENISIGETVTEDVEKILMSRMLIKPVQQEQKYGQEMEKTPGIFSSIFRRKISQEIAEITPSHIIRGEWKKMKFKPYDVNAPAPKIWPGKYHPYLQFLDEIAERLVAMGFEEMEGPLVETAFWNADALFMPQDHPARSIHDVLLLKKPHEGILPGKTIVENVRHEHITKWGGVWSAHESQQLLLRSQTTAVSARTFAKFKDKPGKYFCIDRNFRFDVIDAKHLAEFHQCEGIVIGNNLTFAHLLGYLKEFANMIGLEEIKFVPSYFPFTEPSVEGYVKHPKFGWMEVLPAGIIRPEVLRPFGISSTVLAWGIGISRLAMISLNIDDIRHLFSSDIDWLRNKETVLL